MKIAQLSKDGEDFYPVIGSEGLANVIPVLKGGTGANNADDARANLGIANAFIVDYKESDQMSVPASGIQWGTIDVAKTGYKVLGVVGHYTIGTGDYMTIYACYQNLLEDPNEIVFALGNRFSSSLSTRLRVYVLYIKE